MSDVATDTRDVDSRRTDELDEASAAHGKSLRRRFTWASVAGAVPGAVVFLWVLTRGTFDLFQWQRVGDFYDLQAHSLLSGSLSVNGLRLGVESFTVDGNAYIYQGPIPALLRIPVLLVSGHSLDGRLTQASMLIAYAVIVVFACRLHWRARTLLRGDAPIGTLEAVVVAIFTFALAGASVLVYEASRAWVYHEALLWGCAFALVSIDCMIRYVQRPSWRLLGLSALFAACCLLTRASVGLGPAAGLGLVALGAIAARAFEHWPERLRWLRHLRWLAPGADAPSTGAVRAAASIPALVAATLAPIVAYAVVNYAKFNTLFSVPFYTQGFSIDPERQAFLAENNGSLFGIKFVPTTVLQYLRPDALRFTSTFPFIDFADFPGPIIGDMRFDLFDRSSSLPVALPLFLVLAVVGLWVLFRPASWRGVSPLASLRVPTLAAAASAVTILPLGYIANRYLTDFLPLLVITGVLGLQVVLRRATAPSRGRWVTPGVVALVVVVLWMTWVNLGLALRYQRQWSYNLPPEVVAGFLGFQRDVGTPFGGDGLVVEQRDDLPNGVGRPGRLVAVGDCDGLYLSDGMLTNTFKASPWNRVETSEDEGHHRLRLTFPDLPTGTRVPIFTTGTADAPNILFSEFANDGIAFEYRASDPEFSTRDVPFPIDRGREVTVDVAADWRTELLTVTVDDVVVLDSRYEYRGDDFRIGENPFVADVEPRFPGRIERLPTPTPLCDDLVARARDERS